jgi:hypothetical protein
MKYNIFKGTIRDLKECEGKLMLENCNKAQVKKFCKTEGIDNLLDGDYIAIDYNSGYWLEEAI